MWSDLFLGSGGLRIFSVPQAIPEVALHVPEETSEVLGEEGFSTKILEFQVPLCTCLGEPKSCFRPSPSAAFCGGSVGLRRGLP